MKKFISICLVFLAFCMVAFCQTDSITVAQPGLFSGIIEAITRFINSHTWIVYVLGALFALEQYLASNPKIAANSTFQAIAGVFNWIYKFISPIKK